jgi:hypothetical protein
VVARDLAHQREAEASAALGETGRAVPRLEDALALGRRNPWAAVLHPQPGQAVRAGPNARLHG